jgi:hypothetical protein
MTSPDPAELLARARRLFAQATALDAPTLDDDDALRREAVRIAPVLEEMVGRRYGRLPRIGYRRGLEARLAGPWSQYLTLGLGATRLVRMTARETSRAAIPTILAHELAHRYAFDESVTTLRGLEVSARLAEAGDPLHARAARLELARLALGAAMASALRAGRPEPIDRFFDELAPGPASARSREHWARVRARAAAPDERMRARSGVPDVVTMVYAEIPCAGLFAAAASGGSAAPPPVFPRFPIDSPQAVFTGLITAADALTGRRRTAVPIAAALHLWSAASR